MTKSTNLLCSCFCRFRCSLLGRGARGAIFGMTRNTGVSELVKSAIDSVAYQTKDLIISMEKDSGIKINKLKVDGGMVKNEQFLQFFSNILLLNCDSPKDNRNNCIRSSVFSWTF